MPKIIDHDERRAEIAECAVRAVAQHGLDRVKLEHVAEIAGCTTGALMYFHPSKRAVLEAALGLVMDRLGERYEAAVEEADLATALASVLPLDAARRREWKVWLSYWGMAAFKSHLRNANHAFYERNRVWIRRLLEAAIERGEVRRGLDEGAVIDQIIELTDGIGVRATLDPQAWPATKQKAQIVAYIKLLGK